MTAKKKISITTAVFLHISILLIQKSERIIKNRIPEVKTPPLKETIRCLTVGQTEKKAIRKRAGMVTD
jgi:hypothetical protein